MQYVVEKSDSGDLYRVYKTHRRLNGTVVKEHVAYVKLSFIHKDGFRIRTWVGRKSDGELLCRHRHLEDVIHKVVSHFKGRPDERTYKVGSKRQFIVNGSTRFVGEIEVADDGLRFVVSDTVNSCPVISGTMPIGEMSVDELIHQIKDEFPEIKEQYFSG